MHEEGSRLYSSVLDAYLEGTGRGTSSNEFSVQFFVRRVTQFQLPSVP